MAVFKTLVQFETSVDTVFMDSLTVTFRNVTSAPLDKGGGVSLEFSFLDRDRLKMGVKDVQFNRSFKNGRQYSKVVGRKWAVKSGR